jgi:hypothetical protein
MTGSEPPSRADLLAWYRRNRERSSMLFDLLSDGAYYSQPIALRHPIVFYEGHLPAFSFNTLVKKALGGPSIDEHLEALFARGIDPDEPSSGELPWPSRDVVRSFADEADRRVVDALQNADLDQPGHPFPDAGEAVFSILEHEAMHHETLLYMWHRLPFSDKKKPLGYSPQTEGVSPLAEWVEVPGGGRQCSGSSVARFPSCGTTNVRPWSRTFRPSRSSVTTLPTIGSWISSKVVGTRMRDGGVRRIGDGSRMRG